MSLQAPTIKLGFDYPLVLLALPLVYVVLLILYYKSRRNRLELEKLLEDTSTLKHLRKPLTIAKLLAATLLVVSAASPFIEHRVATEITIENIGSITLPQTHHILLVDASKSMTYSEGAWTRISLAKKFLKKYLSYLNASDLVTLVEFCGEIKHTYAGSPREASEYVEKISAGYKYTAIGDALQYGLSLAKLSQSPVVVILVSDGKQNYGSDPIKVAEHFTEEKVPLIVISVTSSPLLEEIASVSGGKIFYVDKFTADILSTVVSKACSTAKYSALKARGKTVIYTWHRDYTISYALGLLALLLLLASLLDGV